MARRYSKQTFTKIWTNRILWFGCIWISLTYVLAFFDKVNIAETLCDIIILKEAYIIDKETGERKELNIDEYYKQRIS